MTLQKPREGLKPDARPIIKQPLNGIEPRLSTGLAMGNIAQFRFFTGLCRNCHDRVRNPSAIL